MRAQCLSRDLCFYTSMAYVRSVAARASLIARRYQPSISYIPRDDDRKQHSTDESLSHQKINRFLQQRFSGSSHSLGFGSFHHDRRCFPFYFPSSLGFASCRYMSTAFGEEADKIKYRSDVSGVLSDTTVMDAVASQAPAMSEVAIAAADSKFPVAMLQYLIDYVHTFSGSNWWVSIVITTLLIRVATIPLLINQLKSSTKLAILGPRIEEANQEIANAGKDRTAMAESYKRMAALFKESGVNPLTPFKGILIQAPIFVSFYFAITNMIQKVPSFKSGGAFWFTDLTTPDSLYILPVLSGLTMLITVECNAQEGMEGNNTARTMKNMARGLAFATIFFTSTFPKGIFCYWLTSGLFSLVYGLVIKRPGVKKFLGVPEMPKAPPLTAPKSELSWAMVRKNFEAFRQLPPPALTQQPPMALTQQSSAALTQQPSALQVKSSKPAPNISSFPVLNERMKNLGRVQGRRKGKKRH